MEQEPKSACQQPDGSGESAVELSGERLTRNEREQKPATSKSAGSKEGCAADNAKAGTNKEPADTKASEEQRKEAPPQEQSNEQGEDVKPVGDTTKETVTSKVSKDTEIQEDLYCDDKGQLENVTKPGYYGPDGDQKASRATPTDREMIKTSSADVAPGDGDEGSAEGDRLDEDSGQQANDESQSNSAGDSNEKSAGECLSPSVTTGVPRTSQMSQEEPSKEEKEKQMKKTRKKEKPDVETIGPTTTQAELSEETGILGGGKRVFMAVAMVVLVAILTQYLLQSESPPQKIDLRQVDVFLKRMEQVKTRFPNQRAELWSRSEIHLKRHLQTSQPAEPVSLILTSGFKAKKTMRCLARDVAYAFSAALNASVLQIDGTSKAGKDSDQVKLDIDRKLEGAFKGDKPVAVIHRLEELPPGSTLIFYRYCDHENAAYKKTFLIFTVLLGDEEEIPAEMHLSLVEEMVDDHLQKKFLSHSHPVSFDRMDLNKYGGLWSRISHLILPVAAEERLEREGC